MIIENKIQLMLLTEAYDACEFVKEEDGNLFFTAYLEYLDEEHEIKCIPFENDDNEKGYTILAYYNNHHSEVTTRLIKEM